MNIDRIEQDLYALAKIGYCEEDHGIYRQAFSKADLEARKWLTEQLIKLDMQSYMDGAGNIIGRYGDPDRQAILIGSHLDTVPRGGMFDGALGVIAGVAFGIGAGTIKSDEDVIKGMSASMATLGGYLVLVFFAAQFVAYFNWTQLGLIFAVEGAEFLKSIGLPSVPLFIGFILLTAAANLFMGSASAKWALMAPVFVPMFMLLGYSPEVTQVAYRVGDSVTNIISPMMSYFALIIAFFQRYEPKAGIGTLVATMLPYSMAFLVGWSIVFGVWLAFGFPIGPDSPLTYPAAAHP